MQITQIQSTHTARGSLRGGGAAGRGTGPRGGGRAHRRLPREAGDGGPLKEEAAAADRPGEPRHELLPTTPSLLNARRHHRGAERRLAPLHSAERRRAGLGSAAGRRAHIPCYAVSR
jgi:hypothetical protein